MLVAVSVGLAKLWLTLGICLGVILLRIVVAAILRALRRGRPRNRLVFWTDQAASLAALVCVLVACVAIWVDDPARLTSALGLASAGVAIAAQKAVTSIRFMVPEHGIREIKDRISRKILADLDAAGIGIGSTTMEVTLMNRS